jgi:hypothetical protein
VNKTATTPDEHLQGARKALALLAVMTVAAIGGPFLIALVIRGGARPDWPPDRPVEWFAFVGVTGLVVALLLTTLVIAFRARSRSTR